MFQHSLVIAGQVAGTWRMTRTADHTAIDVFPLRSLTKVERGQVKQAAERYGTKLYPETWFIDKRGVIRARFDGGREWMKPLHLEFARSLRGPITCQIPFDNQNPDGPLAGLCADVPLSI